MAGNFIAMVFATLENEGLYKKGMSTDEAIQIYNKLKGNSKKFPEKKKEENQKEELSQATKNLALSMSKSKSATKLLTDFPKEEDLNNAFNKAIENLTNKKIKMEKELDEEIKDLNSKGLTNIAKKYEEIKARTIKKYDGEIALTKANNKLLKEVRRLVEQNQKQ